MKKLCLLLAAILLLTLCGCGAEEENDRRSKREQPPLSAQESVAEALTALTIGTDEHQEPRACMIGADGQLTIPKNSGLAAALGSYVTYEIQNIETDGDSGAATVLFTAPDTVSVLKQVMEYNDDPASEEFSAKLTELLEDAPPMLEFTVRVELQNVDGSWGIVPSFELSNALTGGLTAEYQASYEQLMDKLMEGGAK